MNINERFTAELTEKGAEIWNEAWLPVVPVVAGAVIEAPLWELMQVFGPHTHHGMTAVHFKDNAITKTGDAHEQE